MFCPFCSNNETIVKDSRIADDGSSIKRRRHCIKCDSRFTTFERIQFKEITVIKKSLKTEFFDRDKLTSSIKMAVRKRDISAEIVENIVNDITKTLNEINENEVESSHIGELVMQSLKKLDKVAFVRFASVYKNFNNTKDFEEFINSLSK